jgi:hypothetical protein
MARSNAWLMEALFVLRAAKAWSRGGAIPLATLQGWISTFEGRSGLAGASVENCSAEASAGRKSLNIHSAVWDDAHWVEEVVA